MRNTNNRVVQRLQDYIQQISKARSFDAIYAVSESFALSYDFQYFAYTARIPVSLVEPEYIYINNYPEDLWDYYKKNNCIEEDPLFNYCVTNTVPVAWHETGRYMSSKSDVLFMRDIASYGIYNGVSIPMHSHKGEAALLSFATSKTYTGIDKYIDSVTADLMLFASYMHKSVDRSMLQQDRDVLKDKISQRERECLLWSAEGKTTQEIAHILRISSNTVTFHIQNVVRKLGASNRQQAIARVISLGIVTPVQKPLLYADPSTVEESSDSE